MKKQYTKTGIIFIKKQVKEYLMNYQKSKIQLECFEMIKADKNQINELRMFVLYVEKTLELFSKEQNELLHYEFMTRFYDKNWWVKQYTRDDFIKFRDETIKEFYLFTNKHISRDNKLD